MRFFETTIKGTVTAGLVVNTLWHRQDDNTEITNAVLQAVHDHWNTTYKANWLAVHTTNYSISEVSVQGYDQAWDREPFLPLVVPHVDAGTDALTSAPAFVAAIAAMKIEPIVTAPRVSPPAPFPNSHVRRGYLAVSPISEAQVEPDGQFASYAAGSGIWWQFLQNLKANWAVAGQTNPLEPIRVSTPKPQTVLRGYGLVRDASWKRYCSTRRSRMFGHGA